MNMHDQILCCAKYKYPRCMAVYIYFIYINVFCLFVYPAMQNLSGKLLFDDLDLA